MPIINEVINVPNVCPVPSGISGAMLRGFPHDPTVGRFASTVLGANQNTVALVRRVTTFVKRPEARVKGGSE